MEAIGLVDQAQAARIRQVLSVNDRFMRVTAWDSLVPYLGRGDAAVILNPRVANPCLERDRSEQARFAQRLSATPFVLYVSLRDLRLAMPYVRGGAVDILVKDHTDSPSEIRDALRSGRSSSSEILLRHVIEAIGDSHPSVRAVFEELCRRPQGAMNAKDLISGTTVAERTLYRTVTRAGLAPVGVIVRVMRAANAFDLMRFHGYSLERAAHAVGYSSARQLSGHIRSITGRRSASAKTLTQGQFVETALRVLGRHDIQSVG